MKIKTADLIGPALDWAVAKCEGLSVVVITVEDQAKEHERVLRDHYSDAAWQEHRTQWNIYVRPTLKARLAVLDSEGFPNRHPFMQNGQGAPLAFSTDWSQCGPLLEREKIVFDFYPDGSHEHGGEWLANTPAFETDAGVPLHECFGPTPLIATMRALVASKLGDAVDVPDELV